MAVCFDLDATLLDHPHASRSGLESLACSPTLRREVDAELLTKWMEIEEQQYIRFERGEISYLEQRRQRLREVFPEACAHLPSEELDSLYDRYLSGYEEGWRLYPEASPVLQELAARSTAGQEGAALITNGPSDLQRRKVQVLNLAQYFPVILVSGELPWAKPDARIFHAACQLLESIPSKTKFIGDNFKNDVEGSAAAGLQAVWINRERRPRPVSAANFTEIHSLSELRFPS